MEFWFSSIKVGSDLSALERKGLTLAGYYHYRFDHNGDYHLGGWGTKSRGYWIPVLE